MASSETERMEIQRIAVEIGVRVGDPEIAGLLLKDLVTSEEGGRILGRGRQAIWQASRLGYFPQAEVIEHGRHKMVKYRLIDVMRYAAGRDERRRYVTGAGKAEE